MRNKVVYALKRTTPIRLDRVPLACKCEYVIGGDRKRCCCTRCCCSPTTRSFLFRTNCTDVPGSKVTSFVDVPPSDEMALLSAVAMQPISVAIQANQFVFQFYKTGVITDDSCGNRGSIDHGVLAVGYGTDLETQEPYFLVKNSWGGTWGEDGYVKLGRKTKNKWGMCAILKMASFPVVE